VVIQAKVSNTAIQTVRQRFKPKISSERTFVGMSCCVDSNFLPKHVTINEDSTNFSAERWRLLAAERARVAIDRPSQFVMQRRRSTTSRSPQSQVRSNRNSITDDADCLVFVCIFHCSDRGILFRNCCRGKEHHLGRNSSDPKRKKAKHRLEHLRSDQVGQPERLRLCRLAKQCVSEETRSLVASITELDSSEAATASTSPRSEAQRTASTPPRQASAAAAAVSPMPPEEEPVMAARPPPGKHELWRCLATLS